MVQVQAEMDAIGARLGKEFPAENEGWAVRIASLRQMMIGNVKSALLVLLGRGGTGVVDRLREHRELAAYACNFASARDCCSRDAGCRTSADCASVAERDGGARSAGRIDWNWPGVLGRACAEFVLPESVPRVNAIGVDNTVLGFAVLLSAVASIAFWLGASMVRGEFQFTGESARRWAAERARAALDGAPEICWRPGKSRWLWCCW